VAQIVQKNAEARGGLEAWRKVQTMVWIGRVESANGLTRFVLALKRPNKTRFEVRGTNQMAVRVYDGNAGWKLHPARGGAPQLQPYTPEELKFAHDEQVIDGLLIDHEAKGIGVVLEGKEMVEDRQAYRLALNLPSGLSRHVWVDALTFLEIKSERESRNILGQSHTIVVFYRNYKAIDGLQIPLAIESASTAGREPDKLLIDRISINPPLDDWMFAKPGTPRNRVTEAAGGETPSASVAAGGAAP